MIFLYLAAAISAVLTFSLGILPGETFLAMPAAVPTALETVAGYAGWFLGLAGSDIKTALLIALGVIVGIEVFMLSWKVLTRWRPPVLGKFLH